MSGHNIRVSADSGAKMETLSPKSQSVLQAGFGKIGQRARKISDYS